MEDDQLTQEEIDRMNRIHRGSDQDTRTSASGYSHTQTDTGRQETGREAEESQTREGLRGISESKKRMSEIDEEKKKTSWRDRDKRRTLKGEKKESKENLRISKELAAKHLRRESRKKILEKYEKTADKLGSTVSKGAKGIQGAVEGKKRVQATVKSGTIYPQRQNAPRLKTKKKQPRKQASRTRKKRPAPIGFPELMAGNPFVTSGRPRVRNAPRPIPKSASKLGSVPRVGPMSKRSGDSFFGGGGSFTGKPPIRPKDKNRDGFVSIAEYMSDPVGTTSRKKNKKPESFFGSF